MKTKLQIIHTVKSFDPIASELAASIENHDLDKFKAIIDNNPEVLRMGNIYARDESSRDVFPYIIAMGSYEHLLAIYGFGEGISYIINNNKYANWNCLDGGIRHTPLMYAAMTGNTETAQKLIALGVNVNQFDSCGYTPLMHAALKGHTATVEKLIALGADVDNANNEGSTPLIWAAREGHTDTVEKLIELGADVNKANKRHGYTPLMIAAREGHIESVKKLIAHGADVNKADRYSKTPLMFAAWNHRIEIVKILIAHGADKVTDKKHIKQPILKILKAQEYIDDLLEGKQTRTLNFDATIEEMLLARVENKLSKLLGSGKFIDNINRIQTTFEGHRKTHPIADKVLTKVDDFIDNVLDKDAE
ncbi:MAG: ankyrin repeat protein, partial [Rickettsiaceae bacterium]|nr:ankyrin repeat protein [Rickettsiaceae bacterium]